MSHRIVSTCFVLSLFLLSFFLSRPDHAYAITSTPTTAACLNTLTVTGRVYDTVTGQGISGATVMADTAVSHPFAFTSASDGSYLLSIPAVSGYACEVVDLRIWATGYRELDLGANSTDLFAQPHLDFGLSSLTPTRTPTVGITNTPTRTPTTGITNTPTRTPTAGITNTPTRTSTLTTGATCSPVSSSITAPFAFDGAGTFCWQSTNLGSYINSWNTTSVTLNGVNITNVYIAAASYPAKIGGYWYVGYSSSVAWGHFEAK